MLSHNDAVPNKVRKVEHETAASPEWNILTTNQLIATHIDIQKGFDETFQKNPYAKGFLPAELSEEKALPAWKWLSEGVFSFITSMIAILSPIAMALLWSNVWTKTKDLYYADNKNLEKMADLGMAFLRAAAPTLLLILSVSLSATVLVYAAPIVVGIVLGVGIVYGAIKLAASLKRAYAAYQQKKEAEKILDFITDKPQVSLKNHAVSILANAFAVTMDVLSFVMNYYLGQASQELVSGKEKGLLGVSDTQAGAADYLKGKRLLEVISLGTVFGVIPKFLKQTYQGFKTQVDVYSSPKAVYRHMRDVLTNKIESLKAFWKEGKINKVLTIFVIIFETASIVKSLVFNLIPALVGMAKGLVTKAPKKTVSEVIEEFSEFESPDISFTGEPAVAEKLALKDRSKIEVRMAECRMLQQMIDKKVEVLNTQIASAPENKKRIAKRDFLVSLKTRKLVNISETYEKNITVDEMIENAKRTGPGLFQSVKSSKGEVEKIADAVKDYENKWYSVSARPA